MKIVIDTNVFISGIFFGGLPYKILKAWRDGDIQLGLSPGILEKYTRVSRILNDKYPNVNIQEFIDLVTIKAKLISSYNQPEPICKDPDDDKFIACALSSKTNIIVTGDSHLLELNGYEDLQIMNPRQFDEKYLR